MTIKDMIKLGLAAKEEEKKEIEEIGTLYGIPTENDLIEAVLSKGVLR